MNYAANTDVSSSRSRDEIERTLARYRATSFMYGWEGERAILGFVVNGRQVRFTLTMPERGAREFTRTPSRGNARSADQAEKAYEQAVRQRWRALNLVIKAKLEAVSAGITTFDMEFAVHVLLPDGRTGGDHLLPAIEEAYRTGTMPRLLPGTDGPREIEGSRVATS